MLATCRARQISFHLVFYSVLCTDDKFSGREKSINIIAKVPLVEEGIIGETGAGITQEPVPAWQEYLGR